MRERFVEHDRVRFREKIHPGEPGTREQVADQRSADATTTGLHGHDQKREVRHHFAVSQQLGNADHRVPFKRHKCENAWRRRRARHVLTRPRGPTFGGAKGYHLVQMLLENDSI
jgi:hypothetical protein